jgi:hypothetical protein
MCFLTQEEISKPDRQAKQCVLIHILLMESYVGLLILPRQELHQSGEIYPHVCNDVWKLAVNACD